MAKADGWVVDETETPGEDEADELISYEILNYPADTTLAGYLSQWNTGQLKVPPFQRSYVWDIKKASKLIESFLLGLPVPGVFLFKERSEPHFLIIDGQQRITSAVTYQKGIFAEKVAFKLQGVAPQWDGKSFEELSESDQFKLKNAVMRSTIIQQLKPNDNSSIYHIFERLNTGGVNLNPMEIRQAIGYQPFISLIKSLNASEAWRHLLGQKAKDKRLRDVELVLRVLALSQKLAEYEKPMKSFLNKFVEAERGKDDTFELLAKKFSAACEKAYAELGKKPFHLRGRLNYGVLDSVLATLMQDPKVAGLKEKFDALVKNEKFVEAVTKNTSDASELTTRFDLAAKALS
jgi:hypothetical protein